MRLGCGAAVRGGSPTLTSAGARWRFGMFGRKESESGVSLLPGWLNPIGVGARGTSVVVVAAGAGGHDTRGSVVCRICEWCPALRGAGGAGRLEGRRLFGENYVKGKCLPCRDMGDQ